MKTKFSFRSRLTSGLVRLIHFASLVSGKKYLEGDAP